MARLPDRLRAGALNILSGFPGPVRPIPRPVAGTPIHHAGLLGRRRRDSLNPRRGRRGRSNDNLRLRLDRRRGDDLDPLGVRHRRRGSASKKANDRNDPTNPLTEHWEVSVSKHWIWLVEVSPSEISTAQGFGGYCGANGAPPCAEGSIRYDDEPSPL